MLLFAGELLDTTLHGGGHARCAPQRSAAQATGLARERAKHYRRRSCGCVLGRHP